MYVSDIYSAQKKVIRDVNENLHLRFIINVKHQKLMTALFTIAHRHAHQMFAHKLNWIRSKLIVSRCAFSHSIWLSKKYVEHTLYNGKFILPKWL